MANLRFFHTIIPLFISNIVTFRVFTITFLVSTLSIYLFTYLLDLTAGNAFETAYGKLYEPISLNTYSDFQISGNKDRLFHVNSSNTFFTKGLLSTVLSPDPTYMTKFPSISTNQQEKRLIHQNQTQNQNIQNYIIYKYPKLVSGKWKLNVSQGWVTNFEAKFKLIKINGVDKHYLEILNFQHVNNSSINFEQFSTTSIQGLVDIKIDKEIFHKDIPITIQIFRINTIALIFHSELINRILYNNVILGIMDSFRNFNDQEILIY